jgi:hypothetical protein
MIIKRHQEPVAPDSVPVRNMELSRRCRGHVGRRLRVLHPLDSRGRYRTQVTVVPVKHPGQGIAEVAQKVSGSWVPLLKPGYPTPRPVSA